MEKGRKPDQLNRAVRVSFRLSRDELARIAPSIQMVADCYRAAEANGGHPDRLLFQVLRPKELERFDKPLMKMLLGLADWIRVRLSHPYSTYRLNCHVFELAAMSFSIRLMRRQHRHGHLRGAFQFPKERLQRKLENLRRRAARRAKKETGEGIYTNLQVRWHGLERWIAFCLFHCDCYRPALYPAFRRRRRYIAIAVDIAAGAIRQQLNRTPSHGELHWLVRRAFRYARLGRIAFSIRDLVSDTPETRDEYVYLYRIWAAQIADSVKEECDEELVRSTGV